MPVIAGYSLSARSSACCQVGGDYLDIVAESNGSHLSVIADVAGKGLASALICTSFRSAFRALARQSLPLEEFASRLSQQHWEEGAEARRRYVTAKTVRVAARDGTMQRFVLGDRRPILTVELASRAIDVDLSMGLDVMLALDGSRFGFPGELSCLGGWERIVAGRPSAGMLLQCGNTLEAFFNQPARIAHRPDYAIRGK